MKTTYIVELTKDEAINLVMFRNSRLGGAGHPSVQTIEAVASALTDADPALGTAQFKRWQKLRQSAEISLTAGSY